MGFLRRLAALVRKEFLQVSRDNSSILIGTVFPIILILIIGYGISLDIKNIPIAVVLEDSSPTATDTLNFLDGSEYYSPRYVTSMKDAEFLMKTRKVNAILRVPPDFLATLMKGDARLQLILYGGESITATAIQGYVEAAVRQINAQAAAKGSVTIENRMWFNDANSSTWYFIPGLVMIIETIVGVFLTALVMAREWERGTLESLFVTPVKLLEILLAKMIPYFCVAMGGFFLCLIAAKFLYAVPMQGSLLLILLMSILYLFVALGIGLVISAVTKSQFIAAQLSLTITFMPALMLTGFLYDLRCTPKVVSLIGNVLPQTFYLEVLKTLFLAGNNWTIIFRNGAVLILYAIFFIGLALKVTKKRVE